MHWDTCLATHGEECWVWMTMWTAKNGGETYFHSTRDILIDKHPLGKQPEGGSLLNDTPEPINSVFFDCLGAEAICHLFSFSSCYQVDEFYFASISSPGWDKVVLSLTMMAVYPLPLPCIDVWTRHGVYCPVNIWRLLFFTPLPPTFLLHSSEATF